MGLTSFLCLVNFGQEPSLWTAHVLSSMPPALMSLWQNSHREYVGATSWKERLVKCPNHLCPTGLLISCECGAVRCHKGPKNNGLQFVESCNKKSRVKTGSHLMYKWQDAFHCLSETFTSTSTLADPETDAQMTPSHTPLTKLQITLNYASLMVLVWG